MDNNILSNNNLEEQIKNKPKTKLEKYINERKEIIQKIFEIINVQSENNIKFFYADEITEENEKEILNLKNNIKRYFIVNTWISFKNTVKLDKVHMSLIRNILKHENINYTICQKMINVTKKTKSILLDNNEI